MCIKIFKQFNPSKKIFKQFKLFDNPTNIRLPTND